MSEQVIAQTDCIVVNTWFKDGDVVPDGAELLQVEVCKMMIPMNSTAGGVVKYYCKKDDYVMAGSILAEVT